MRPGVPAFPRPYSQGERGDGYTFDAVPSQEGMSLRDYFAAKALQGHVSESNILARAMDEKECELMFVNAAAFAYRCADAMLRERDKS